MNGTERPPENDFHKVLERFSGLPYENQKQIEIINGKINLLLGINVIGLIAALIIG